MLQNQRKDKSLTNTVYSVIRSSKQTMRRKKPELTRHRAFEVDRGRSEAQHLPCANMTDTSF